MRLPPYTALDWLTWGAEQAAQTAVLVTALRLPKLRPHALFFVWILASDAAQRAIEALYLERVAVPGMPPAGAARALYHVVQALSTAWPALVAALVWWAFHAGQVPGLPSSSPTQRQGDAWPNGRQHEPPQSSVAPQVPSALASRIGSSTGISSPVKSAKSWAWRFVIGVVYVIHMVAACCMRCAVRFRGPERRTARGATPEPSIRSEPVHRPKTLAVREGGIGLQPQREQALGARRRLFPCAPALITIVTLPLPVKAIFALWLALNALLIAAHPLPRGWTQPALHAFAGLCVVLGAVAIVAGWARRHERAAQVAGYLVVVQGVVCIVGPWAGNVFASWRTVGAGMYAVAFSLLAAWQWYQSPQAQGRRSTSSSGDS